MLRDWVLDVQRKRRKTTHHTVASEWWVNFSLQAYRRQWVSLLSKQVAFTLWMPFSPFSQVEITELRQDVSQWNTEELRRKLKDLFFPFVQVGSRFQILHLLLDHHDESSRLFRHVLWECHL